MDDPAIPNGHLSVQIQNVFPALKKKREWDQAVY